MLRVSREIVYTMFNFKNTLSLLILILLISGSAFADIKLPQLIRDSMVLQRNQPIKLWGWASPAEKVKVYFNGKSASTITNAAGKWQVTLASAKAGGPFEIRLQGNNLILLKDVLVGDVWLCSGQSNMVHQM